jgi:hypothetical protein
LREVLPRSFDRPVVLSAGDSSVFSPFIVSVWRCGETGVALAFGLPVVDSSRDVSCPASGEADAVAAGQAVAATVAAADTAGDVVPVVGAAVTLGEALAIGVAVEFAAGLVVGFD